MLYVIIFIAVFAVWGTIGYRKGAPHGLGMQGIMYSMIGIFGMRKLDRLIMDKKRDESAARRAAEAAADTQEN